MVVANRGEGDKAFAGFFGCSVSPAISSGSTLFQLHYDSRSSYDDRTVYIRPSSKANNCNHEDMGVDQNYGPFWGLYYHIFLIV